MQPLPFTPEFNSDVQGLTEYIERNLTTDKEAVNVAQQLKSQYGEIRYGVFAFLAKLSVYEVAGREISSLSSYAEKILSENAALKEDSDDRMIENTIAEFEQSWTSIASVKDSLMKLGRIAGTREVFLRLLHVAGSIRFEVRKAIELTNLIDNCSPKALKNSADEMQSQYISFHDGCLAAHKELNTKSPERLKELIRLFLGIRRYPQPISPEEAKTQIAWKRGMQWTRGLISAEKKLSRDKLLYELITLKEKHTWKELEREQIRKGRRFKTQNKNDKTASDWEEIDNVTVKELELLATGENVRGLYRTRRDLERSLFDKYMNLFVQLGLQASLNQFSNFSPLLNPLFEDLDNHAELVEVLDIVLFGKDNHSRITQSPPTG